MPHPDEDNKNKYLQVTWKGFIMPIFKNIHLPLQWASTFSFFITLFIFLKFYIASGNIHGYLWGRGHYLQRQNMAEALKPNPFLWGLFWHLWVDLQGLAIVFQ